MTTLRTAEREVDDVRLGSIIVVHGDKKQWTGLADKAKEMGLNANAPKNSEMFTIGSDRVKLKEPPALDAAAPMGLAPVDK